MRITRICKTGLRQHLTVRCEARRLPWRGPTLACLARGVELLRPLLAPWRAGLLCLPLQLAQGLGRAHALSHGLSDAPVPLQEQHGHAGDWIGGSHDAGDADCWLIDQLSHDDCLSSLPLALLALAPAAAVLVQPARVLLPRHAPSPYLARAPPHC